MVMPTGFGENRSGVDGDGRGLYGCKRGKVLLIAPTTGLVDQQRSEWRQRCLMLMLIQLYPTRARSGLQSARLCGQGVVVMATSQVIRNDAVTGMIDLADVGLLIVDEAHHSTGNHAYAQVGDLYLNACPEALILGATASPGSTENHILEVARRLGIERLDVSKKDDPLLSPYTVQLDVVPHRFGPQRNIDHIASPPSKHIKTNRLSTCGASGS